MQTLNVEFLPLEGQNYKDAINVSNFKSRSKIIREWMGNDPVLFVPYLDIPDILPFPFISAHPFVNSENEVVGVIIPYIYNGPYIGTGYEYIKELFTYVNSQGWHVLPIFLPKSTTGFNVRAVNGVNILDIEENTHPETFENLHFSDFIKNSLQYVEDSVLENFFAEFYGFGRLKYENLHVEIPLITRNDILLD